MIGQNFDNAVTETLHAFSVSFSHTLHRWEFDSPDCNMPAAFRLRRAVNSGLLSELFVRFIQLHERLRASFAVMHGEPKQIAAPTRPPLLLRLSTCGGWGARRERCAPRRQLAATMSAIIAAVLRLNEVSVQDNFQLRLGLAGRGGGCRE